MKKILKNILIFFITFLILLSGKITIYANNENKEEEYLKNYCEILEQMKKEMESIERCGDVNIDFLNEMIPHYKCKIETSKNLLKYCKTREVKKIAKNIAKTHKQTLKEMNEILQCIKQKPTSNKGRENEYMKGYDYSYKTMKCTLDSLEKTGDVGKDYLCEMIALTEGSVNFSTNILKFTSNKDIKKIAQNVLNLQNKQIVEMKKLYIKLGE